MPGQLSLPSRRDFLLTTAVGSVASSLLVASDGTTEAAFLVPPYVQLGDAPHATAEESLIVMWHSTPKRGVWVVEFRSAGAVEWTKSDRVTTTAIDGPGLPPHDVSQCVLSPLRPGVPVEYRVLLNGSAVFAASAPARASAPQAFRCVVMGDVGAGSPEQKQVAFQVHSRRPEFVLIPGDFVYNNGRISEYRTSFFPAYTPTMPSPEAGAPLLSSCCFLGGRGQHDAEASLTTHPDGHAFFLYWSFPLNGPVTLPESRHVYPLAGTAERQEAFRRTAGKRFPRMSSFSFDWGNSHWVVLDTWNPRIDWTDSALREWLQADLAAAKDGTWKIVSSYMPPFSSSTRFPQGQKMRVIVDLLEAAGVDLVFSGYAHSYQRTYPLRFRPDANPVGPVTDPSHLVPGTFTFDKRFDGQTQTRPDGIIYIVSGCGG
ncbi:MAG: phosphohydrolase, partial [Gammaproteobacteria bacterium]|nr:phosphohydrolase [Gammaproteobacteria bacterium]